MRIVKFIGVHCSDHVNTQSNLIEAGLFMHVFQSNSSFAFLPSRSCYVGYINSVCVGVDTVCL